MLVLLVLQTDRFWQTHMLLQNLTLLKNTKFPSSEDSLWPFPSNPVSPGEQYFFKYLSPLVSLPILETLCKWTYAQGSLLCSGSVSKDIFEIHASLCTRT